MPFLLPLVAGLGAAATAAAPIIGATAGIAGVISASRGSSQQPQGVSVAPPPTPNYNAIQQAETQNILRANQARTKTILTSPLGVPSGGTGSSTVQRKTLLGQ